MEYTAHEIYRFICQMLIIYIIYKLFNIDNVKILKITKPILIIFN